jgi:hypothetical protein
MQDVEADAQRWQSLVAGVSAVLLLAVAGFGALLTWRYRPAFPTFAGPDGSSTGTLSFILPEGSRWSRYLVGRHREALLVASVSTVVWSAITIRRMVSSRPASLRRAITGAAALLVPLLTLLTWFSWNLVEWDQLGLWAVTAGKDYNGLWPAAFDDDVRFVMVGGSEVNQSTFTIWVVIHLIAPMIALFALVVGWRSSRGLVAAGSVGTPARVDASPPPGATVGPDPASA